ncbi:MAG: putative Ig domain-containing protein [Gemmatimonadetes bacterium]|nr:putative Ig domain-containing protein [Gemmatimonadota bacterium]
MPRPLRIVPFFAALAAVMWVASCGGDGGTIVPPPPPNQSPAAVGSIAAQTIAAGESVTVNVASNFNDPDGDALTYTAATSDAGVATASLAGSNVTITGVAAGSATITVTARDPDGATATQSIGVTVEAANQAPVPVGSLGDLSFPEGGEVTVFVAEYFSDPDGDALTYTAASSDTTVATATASDTTVVVAGVGAGSATVTVTATDPGGLSATQDMAVMILQGNQAPQLADSIPAQMIVVGETIMIVVSGHFMDPEGAELTFEAVSSDTGIATALASNDTVTIGGVAAGRVSVTVSASDPEGLAASQEVMVTVEQAMSNRAPQMADEMIPFPAHDLVLDSAIVLDVSGYFVDPDDDPLVYTATTSDEAVATAAVDGSVVTTTALSAMEDEVLAVTLTVTATDPEGLSFSQEAEVFVAVEDYSPWVGLTISEEAKLVFGPITLGGCFTRAFIRLATAATGQIDVHWTEWQLRKGTGWVRVPDTRKVAPDDMPSTDVICPYTALEDGTAAAGTYRVVGEVTIMDADGNPVRIRQRTENEFTHNPEEGDKGS